MSFELLDEKSENFLKELLSHTEYYDTRFRLEENGACFNLSIIQNLIDTGFLKSSGIKYNPNKSGYFCIALLTQKAKNYESMKQKYCDSEEESRKVENMKFIANELSDMRSHTHDRFKNIEDKLNMLLVFNAAFLILVSNLIPNKTSILLLYYIRFIFLILFLVLNICSVLFIILGMQLKHANEYEIPDFSGDNFIKEKQGDIIYNFINQYKENIETKRKIIEIKQKKFQIASILIIINLFVAVVGITINFI